MKIHRQIGNIKLRHEYAWMTNSSINIDEEIGYDFLFNYLAIIN
jgi:hypothetical protein